MRTYVSHVQVNSGDIMPIGPTLYGVCNTSPAILTKRVSLSMFDRLVHGVTVAIKFTYGNTAVNNVKLQVADTLAFPILGDCTCGSNEVISFTFEELDVNNKYWHAHTSGLSDNIKNYIINQINTSTDTPDVFIMKGTVGIGGNPGSLPTSGYEIGWAYRVISDGTYAGQGCKTGELIIAIANATPNQSSVNADHWMIVPAKLDSVVVGPDYAHDGHIALFDGPTGERIKESPYTIEASVPGNAVFTDTTYTAGTGLQLDTDTNEFSVHFGDTANTVTQGNDPRLSDAREPLSHNHGNINNDGTLEFDVPVVNALLKIDSHKKIAAGPIFSANDSNKFLNESGTWLPTVLTINDLTPDSEGNVIITAASLGLEQGIRFIGSVAANSPYKPSDETAPTEQTPLVINGPNPYTPQPGDIIIDHEDNKEYIYTSAGWWEQFGQDGSFKILQSAVTKPATATTDHFVQSISQNENGEITVTYARVESIIGNAVTATTLETPREIYVDLSQSRDSEHPITFDGSADISISVNGILPIEHGGTGTDTFSPNQVLLTNNAQTVTEFITRAYIDNVTAIALSTSNSFITERTVYYGLPYINHSHTYNSYDDFYMPETSGSSTQILISGGTNNAPVWATEAKIHETITNNILTCTTLELGSTSTSQEGAVSEGQIKLYSSGAGAHIISGVTHNTDVEHILPAAGGIIIQMHPDEATVGGPCQPVYVDTNGIITAITYTTNRIYYGVNHNEQNEYIASGHYIDYDKIIISLNNLNPGTITDALYVNGNAATTGNISVGSDAAVGNDLTVTRNTTIGGNTTISGITSITNTTDAEEISGTLSGALVVAGGASITKKLIVGDHASFKSTAEVSENMSIGLALESDLVYALTIKSSAKAIEILGTHGAAAYMDIGEGTDTQTQAAYDYLTFIPNIDAAGYIGTTSQRWKEGHFSDLLRIGEANGNEVTIENNGTVTIASSQPCILLKTADSSDTPIADWVLQNVNGTFELSDSANVNLIGNAYGFKLKSRLYINPNDNISDSDSLDLYVNGLTQLTGRVGIGIAPDSIDVLTINGNTTIVDSNGNAIAHLNIETINNIQQVHFFPSVTNTGILGQGGNTPYRWSKLYIGSVDQYGDPYAPIYWNDGIPIPISGTVQYHLFTIAANSSSVTISSTAYTTNTFVLQIVVLSGESSLTAPIDWVSNNGSITLSTSTVTANVSGYILTARGCAAP